MNPPRKNRRKLKTWLSAITVIILITLLGYHFVPRFPFGPFTLYEDLTAEEKTEPLVYNVLSNEDTYPFKPHQNFDDARNPIIEKYFDPRSCLVKSQRKADVLDLRLIDWNKFRSYHEVEVCLWRIFSSFENTEDTQTWLEFHGFSVTGPRKNTTPLLYWGSGTFDTFSNRKTKTTPSHFPAKGIQIGNLIGWKPYAESIRIRTSQDGQVLDVDYALLSK